MHVTFPLSLSPVLHRPAQEHPDLVDPISGGAGCPAWGLASALELLVPLAGGGGGRSEGGGGWGRRQAGRQAGVDEEMVGQEGACRRRSHMDKRDMALAYLPPAWNEATPCAGLMHRWWIAQLATPTLTQPNQVHAAVTLRNPPHMLAGVLATSPVCGMAGSGDAVAHARTAGPLVRMHVAAAQAALAAATLTQVSACMCVCVFVGVLCVCGGVDSCEVGMGLREGRVSEAC